VPATYFKITQNFIEKMVEKHDFDKDELISKENKRQARTQ
jgi:hypothetical protein